MCLPGQMCSCDGVHQVLPSFLSVLFSALPESLGNGSSAGTCSAWCCGYDKGTNPDLHEITGVLSQALLQVNFISNTPAAGGVRQCKRH